MKRNDWIGLATSIAVHALVLFLFTFLTAARADEQRIGYIEVDLGPLAESRPVQRAVNQTQDAVEEQNDPPQPEPEAAAPEEAKPVDAPDQTEEVVDEEKVTAPETETISPETRDNPEPTRETEPKPEQRPVRPLGSGSVDGTSGSASGADGGGNEDDQSAPYQIEGLNRDAVFAPLPLYREQVNATIRVRITVDPHGRITQRLPLIKGNPSLEQAVMEALQRWRFNPLPPNAPQESQTGVVTFRFRLE